MNKMLLIAVDSILVGLLITGCGKTGMLTVTAMPIIPTSTLPVSTATVLPPITSTPELPISPEAAAYLGEALDIMKHTSLYQHRIDWEAVYASAFKIAEHAQTPADTYNAIRFALDELGDHHSHFRPPEEIVEIEQTTVNDIPLPHGKLLLDKIGFIKVLPYNSPNQSDNRKYATIVQHLIRDLDTQGVCGWIVDVREHTGGSSWPILAGLGPILGEGELGAMVDADGNKSVWAYQAGQIVEEESAMTYINGPAYQLKVDFPPVAVLRQNVERFTVSVPPLWIAPPEPSRPA